MSGWDDLSLSDRQIQCLDDLGALVACPIEAAAARETQKDKESGSRGPQTIREWYMQCADQDHEESSPVVERAIEKLNELKSQELHCARLLKAVNQVLMLVDQIEGQHQAVESKTCALNKTCDRLLAEHTNLKNQVRRMSEPLEYFNELEVLGPLLGVPISANNDITQLDVSMIAPTNMKVFPGSDQFMDVVQRIERSLTYLEANPHFTDTPLYHAKMSQLYTRALSMVKHQVLELIKNAAKAAKANASSTTTKFRTKSFETSAVFTKFRAVAERVNALVRLLVAQSQRTMNTLNGQQHVLLMDECHQAYFAARLDLLRATVQEQLEQMSTEQGVLGLTRLGSSYLAGLCHLERQLFMSLFSADGSECAVSDTSPLSNENNINNAETQEAQVVGEEEAEQLGKTVRDEGPAGLHVMLVELCNTMYGAMRPFLIHQTDLDTLCQTVGTLREELGTDEEFKDDDVGSNPGDDSAAITSSPDCAVRIILTRLVADAQERLIYCTLVLIREELEDFTPSASALDYPNRCRGPQLEATGDTGMTSRDTYMYSWYPTLRSCLVLLSKIYRAVDISVFQDLAGEAVSLCTTSLIRGASAITNKKGAEDGDLFLIRHLVLLRRELEPFTEVTDWGRLQRGLNFSSTRDALSNFLTRGSGHIFRFRGNSLLALAQQAVPLVDEEKVNSKNELEVQLKAAFSRFIARSVTALSGPLTDLTLKVEAVQAKTRAADQSKGGKGLHAALVALPFLRPDRLLETLTAAERNLALSLPRFLGRMSVYLESFSIRGLLFRPIQRKLLAVVVATQEIVETVVVRGQRDECSGDAETTDTVLNQVVPLRNLLSQMHSRVSKVDLNDSFEFEEELDNVVVDPSKALPPVSQKQEQKQMMDSPPAEKKRTTAPCHKKEGEEKPARTPLPLNGNAITTTTRNNATNGKSLSSLNGNTTSTSTAPSRGDVTAVKSDSTDETLPPFKGEARTTTTDATNKTSAAAAALNGTAERGGEEGGGVCDYRSQLVAFYKLYNPSKLDTVDSTLKKFAGREETLLKKLHDKYAPQAKAADAAPAPSGSTNKSVPQAKKDEPSVPPQDNMIDAGYRARMEAFYLEHNPEKVGTIDATLVKFSGREEVLIKKLHAKYKIPYKAPGVGQ